MKLTKLTKSAIALAMGLSAVTPNIATAQILSPEEQEQSETFILPAPVESTFDWGAEDEGGTSPSTSQATTTTTKTAPTPPATTTKAAPTQPATTKSTSETQTSPTTTTQAPQTEESTNTVTQTESQGTTTVVTNQNTNTTNYTPVTSVQAPSVEQTTTLSTSEGETTTVAEETTEINLLDGDFLTFNANMFTSETEADEFIAKIEADEATKDRFEVEKEVLAEDKVIVRVSYKQNVEDTEGRAILFYVQTDLEKSEENNTKAAEYAQEVLTTMPDLLYAAEVVEFGEKLGVVFGIRPKVEEQKLTYDTTSLEVKYEAERKPYTYVVKADEATGEFDDKIQPAVEAKYPGEFTFETRDISETEREVTMTPVPKENTESSESETTSANE